MGGAEKRPLSPLHLFLQCEAVWGPSCKSWFRPVITFSALRTGVLKPTQRYQPWPMVPPRLGGLSTNSSGSWPKLLVLVTPPLPFLLLALAQGVNCFPPTRLNSLFLPSVICSTFEDVTNSLYEILCILKCGIGLFPDQMLVVCVCVSKLWSRWTSWGPKGWRKIE